MKTNKLYGILSFLMIAFTISSCVKDGDFSVPNVTVEEPKITPNSTLLAIKTALQQEYNINGKLVYTFFKNESSPTYIEGYVVSSDAAGNFYKKLIIQDKVTNPTAGIEVLLNKTSLSETYEVGRKIYIKLDGLSVSYDDGGNNTNTNPSDDIDPTNTIPGKYVLGKINGDLIEEIASSEIKNHIFRSATTAIIDPTIITLVDITEAHVNTMIQLPSAQFLKTVITKTFAGEPNDVFDGFRTILECVTEKTITLQTSTFASFKSNVVPQGKGSFKGVLSKDYRAEILVAIANTPSDLDFTDHNRCDPIELDCGLSTTEGANIIFSDDFESQSNLSLISGNGWTNFIQDGTEGWEAYSSTGSNPSLGISAKISSYNSNDTNTVSWLITPGIDVSSNTGVTIKFQTSNSFSDDSNMQLLFSSDWDSTTAGIASATWGVVSKAYITKDSDSFSNWFDSGLVDLSCGNGITYFAFKYTGSGNSHNDGTYELDNIKISSQ